MPRAPFAWAAAVAALLAVAGCGSKAGSRTASSQPTTHHGFTAAERRAIADQRHAQRAQFSSPTTDARLAGASRAVVVASVERTILRDARRRYAAEELDKRARYVSCSVAPDDASLAKSDPSAPVLRYSCLAVTFRAPTHPPTLIGIDFLARIDFSKPSFAWCRFVPVGGEGAHAAATLAAPPPAACIADPPR